MIYNCIGFKEHKQNLIDASGDVTLNVRLYKNAHQLQEVEISEFRKQTTQMQSPAAKAYKKEAKVSGNAIESRIKIMAGVDRKSAV